MKNRDEQAEKIMIERFGKDTVIALATIEDGMPYGGFRNSIGSAGIIHIQEKEEEMKFK